MEEGRLVGGFFRVRVSDGGSGLGPWRCGSSMVGFIGLYDGVAEVARWSNVDEDDMS